MTVISMLALVGLTAGCTAAPGDAGHGQRLEAPSPAPSAPVAPSAPPAPTADAATLAPAATLPALIAGLDNAQCQTSAGLTACRADGFLIKLRPGHCASDGAYGTVGDGYLLTLPDGQDAAPRVELKGFHFACSVATATRDTPAGAGGLSWEYVVLPPVDTVQTCQRDARACQTRPGASLAWQVDKPAQPCAVTPAGDYAGACPAGWISTDDFGDFGYSQ